MSDCKVFGTEIDEAADGGALGPRAAAHVKSCAACGDELRGREALRGLVSGLGRVDAPPDFEYRLRARMARSKPGGGHGVFGRLFPVSGLAWAAVAVCVLSVTGAVYFRQSQPAGQGVSNVVESARAPEAPTSPTASQSNRAGENGTQQTEQTGDRQTAAAVTAAAVGPRRASNVKRVVSRPRERELAPQEPLAESTGGGSLVADLRPARIQLPLPSSGSDGASRVQTQGIQLGTTAGTLRVAMRDERGALVPMRSVSFGSQEPLSRQTAGGRASTQDEEGVW
jgi:hypothetical protein